MVQDTYTNDNLTKMTKNPILSNMTSSARLPLSKMGHDTEVKSMYVSSQIHGKNETLKPAHETKRSKILNSGALLNTKLNINNLMSQIIINMEDKPDNSKNESLGSVENESHNNLD
jgi:hypothetical protein